jgi:peptidoglycan/xylan/chitin deacetylase (PgdA/CDA1 family)
MNVVPVFQYHSVSDSPPSWIAPRTVAPAAFLEQLRIIADSGLAVVPLRRLVAAIRGGPPLPPRAAVLTFDDGFADFYWTVVEQLAQRDYPSTLFVTTGAIHAPGDVPRGSLLPEAEMLNWRQLSGLDAYGVEIGGHSRTHAQLDTLSGRALWEEIVLCKRELEEAVGHPVTAFAYPHGYSSAAVRRKLGRAGWQSACTAGNAFSSTTDEPMCIPRLAVRAGTTPQTFQSWTEGRGSRTKLPAERLATRTWRTYRRLRARLGRPLR